MELPPWASFFPGILLAIALFVLSILHRRRQNPSGNRKYNLPPGPRPWPVIGNLNLLGPLKHRSIHELSKRYGPLMSLRFGSLPVVVASSVDMARFFLKTHDVTFIDRPRTVAGRYTGYNYSDMLWSPYSAHWRQGRKFFKSEVFTAARLRSQEHNRETEVRAMLRDLYVAGPATPVRFMDHLDQLTINVISLMVLGKKYTVDVDGRSAAAAGGLEWMVKEFFDTGGFDIGDMIPWLSWLPRGRVRRLKRLREMLDRFLDDVVEEHSERRRRAGDGFVAMDTVDLMLELADDPNLEVPIQRDTVKAFTLNLLVGLPDTTSVTVEWAMSELLRNPGALATATEELDRVVGRERLVTEGDIPRLPYMEAVVKETMRLHQVSPLLTPRLSREDVVVSVGEHEHDIPKGTVVFVNVWAIARDPALWGPTAGEFRPERFVESSVDVKGQDLEVLPFGSGRRMCPGVPLGLKMVTVVLASLLHGFAWKLPDGVSREELSMEETFGLSVPRKVPLVAVAEPRLPAHLYAVAGAGP